MKTTSVLDEWMASDYDLMRADEVTRSAPESPSSRTSTLGRPRKLTDAQVAAIMAWHTSPRSGRAKMQVLSLELGGVPLPTIQYCVAIKGRYKKAGPGSTEMNGESHG